MGGWPAFACATIQKGAPSFADFGFGEGWDSRVSPPHPAAEARASYLACLPSKPVP